METTRRQAIAGLGTLAAALGLRQEKSSEPAEVARADLETPGAAERVSVTVPSCPKVVELLKDMERGGRFLHSGELVALPGPQAQRLKSSGLARDPE